MPQKRKKASPSNAKALQQQIIPFEQIYELERWTKQEKDEDAQVFGVGVFIGLWGPLGWLYTFAIVTGRD
jgi:hypothetical protein